MNVLVFICTVSAYQLFHPNHAVISAEFISAPVELSAGREPHTAVKTFACAVYSVVAVAFSGYSYAGVKVRYAFFGKSVFEHAVKRLSRAVTAFVPVEVYSELNAFVVCGAFLELCRVSIAYYPAVCFGDKVGVSLRYALYARGKFLFRGSFKLE